MLITAVADLKEFTMTKLLKIRNRVAAVKNPDNDVRIEYCVDSDK